MSDPDPLFQELFFEVFEALPRQGPGSRTDTARALELCGALPAVPSILDLGCGVGVQTLHLAELTSGEIVAVDLHAPSIERLRRKVAELGLSRRIRPVVADMAKTGLPAGSFDLVWSEGALYNLGLEQALPLCRSLLRPGGRLAFSDAVWRKENPPAEVQALFKDYPTMRRASDVLALLGYCGFRKLGHFTLPDEAWWDDFYTPMLDRLQELRLRYTSQPAALAALDKMGREPALHRKYSPWYAYEFFVAVRND